MYTQYKCYFHYFSVRIGTSDVLNKKKQDNSELYFEKQNTAKDSTIFLNTS